MCRSFELPMPLRWFVVAFLLTGMSAATLAQEPMRRRSPAMGLTWHDTAKGPVVIDEVEPQGTAAKMGLQAGDIVVSVNGQPVSGSATFDRMLKGLDPQQKLVIAVRRGGETIAKSTQVPESRVNMFGAALDADPRGRIVVNEVTPESPAERAGLAQGDIVLTMAGQRHASLSALADFMAHLVASDRDDKTAEPVKVTVQRTGEEEPLALLIERDPAPMPASCPIPMRTLPAPPAQQLALGVEVVEQGKQVAIAKLLEGGPAALAGMMPGDVIAAVGKKPVHSYTELVALVSTLRPGDDVPVDIVRGNKTGAVEVQVVRGKPGVEDVVLVAATDQPLAADRPAPATLEQEVRDLRARVDMLEQIVARLVKELSAQRR